MAELAVECNGECTDSTLGQICDVAGAGWIPVSANSTNAFVTTPPTPCRGDNRCSFFGFLSRDLSLNQVCIDGSARDCRVYCIAP
jgi:hypothetical protein